MKNKEMIGTTWIQKGGLNTGKKHYQDMAVILSCKGKGRIKHGEVLRIYVAIDGDILTKVEKYVSKSESEITTGGADFVLLRIFPQIHLLSRTERREK